MDVNNGVRNFMFEPEIEHFLRTDLVNQHSGWSKSWNKIKKGYCLEERKKKKGKIGIKSILHGDFIGMKVKKITESKFYRDPPPPPFFFLLNKFIEDEHKIFLLKKYNLNAHGLMLYKVKQALVDAS